MKKLCKTDPARSPLEQYLKEIHDADLLSASDEVILANRIAEGDAKAREQMIRANLRLVVNIARAYAGRGLPLQDLIEEGNIGLMTAVQKFDPSFGTRFSTYASYWIKQAIKIALINTSQTIRIPAYIVELRRKWQKTLRALSEELGRSADDAEVQAKLGISDKHVNILRHAFNRGFVQESIDDMLGNISDDSASDPSFQAEHANDLESLAGLLENLDPREQSIITQRFGLNGQEEKTLKEVGEELGLTRERVRQIQADILEALREQLQICDDEEEEEETNDSKFEGPTHPPISIDLAIASMAKEDLTALQILQIRGGIWNGQRVVSPSRTAKVLRMKNSKEVRQQESYARMKLFELLAGIRAPATEVRMPTTKLQVILETLHAQNPLLPEILQLRGGLWEGQVVVPITDAAAELSKGSQRIAPGEVLNLQRMGIETVRSVTS